MTDPRKTYTVKNCPKQQASVQSDLGRRKGILDSITKIGELELLNDVGFGKVGEGLRVLASVSDSVRVGGSVVPGRKNSDTQNSVLGQIANTALDSVDKGAQVVLDATGLGTAAAKVGDFNPGVANRAVGQAKQIFQKVKQGEFELSDIPETFSDLQNLETLAKNVFGSAKTPQQREMLCSASPYAMDLIAYAPKFNFLFIIDITFDPQYAHWKDIGKSTAFVVKRSTRPNVEFEYEDVNMYNFWTKVPKKVTYPPVTMSFYDDNKNSAHMFYTGYTRAMSPIANMEKQGNNSDTYEENSMAFNKLGDGKTFEDSNPNLPGYGASLGALRGNTTSIIKDIKLYHVFDYGNLMNVYNFYNPRILNFTPTDLNMAETGDGAEFDFQFAYDAMFIESGFNLRKDQSKLTNLTDRGTYPIKPVYGDGDVNKHSQQSNGPDAQSQKEGAPSDLEELTGPLTISGPLAKLKNFSSGITGAINDGIATATSRVSNAFSGTNTPSAGFDQDV